MSKRHGKVTRYGAKQTYDIIVMRPTGRSVEHRYTWDELDEQHRRIGQAPGRGRAAVRSDNGTQSRAQTLRHG